MSYIGATPTSTAFLTDSFSGDGSTTSFTLSAAPASSSSILVAVSGVLQDPATYAVVGTALNFTGAPPSGTANISVRYLGIPASNISTAAYRTVTEFTATAGQTSFSTPSYTVGFINVYRNGVLLGSADYTATTGTTVVLASGATAGDLITTESFYVSSIYNAISNTAGSVNSNNIADGAVGTAEIASSVTLTTPTLTSPTVTGQATIPTIDLTGGQITFPATAVPSSNANTLDDYEEGTWTPTYVFSGGNGTANFSLSAATYTKIGNIVLLNLYFNFTKGTASGDFTITGVPFGAYTRSPCTLDWDGGGAASNVLVSEISGSTIYFYTQPQSTTYQSALNAGQMNSAPYPRLTCLYRIA